MTAPDPRLDEIQAIPTAAVEAAAKAYYELGFGSWEGAHADTRTVQMEDMHAALEAAHPVLLAELRKAHEALERVEALADELATQSDGRGLDYSDDDFDRGWHGANRSAVDQLRAAVAAAKGDERG